VFVKVEHGSPETTPKAMLSFMLNTLKSLLLDKIISLY
jgi:hypothetical protein